jgi:hypothetical protein
MELMLSAIFIFYSYFLLASRLAALLFSASASAITPYYLSEDDSSLALAFILSASFCAFVSAILASE